ncbi:response regulator transcription factor [Streptomyces sp. NPDC054864]
MLEDEEHADGDGNDEAVEQDQPVAKDLGELAQSDGEHRGSPLVGKCWGSGLRAADGGGRALLTTGPCGKSAEPAHITEVINTLHEGRRWIDPDVSALAVVDDCPLTDRELDVLRVTGEGYSVADIAIRLSLAQGTVRNHLSNAMQKTQTRTRHEAARYAREHDWL